jgi:hypothetical protein
MLNSIDAKWEKLTNKVNNFKMAVGAALLDIASANTPVSTDDLIRANNERAEVEARTGGHSVAVQFIAGFVGFMTGSTALQNAIENVLDAAETSAVKRAYNIGSRIAAGIVGGIYSGEGALSGAGKWIGETADKAARGSLEMHSPSRVFFRIGQDTVQGFIDGISSLQASAQRAMANVVDVRNIKGAKFTKADAAGLELLGSLAGELARVNAETKTQQVLIDLTAGKYGKLNAEIRNRIVLAAQEYDRLNNAKEGLSQLNSAWDEYITKALPVQSATEQINALLADPKTIEGMKSFNAEMRTRIESMLRLGAVMQDTADVSPGLGRPDVPGGGIGLPEDQEIIPPPPPVAPYDAFFGHIHDSLDRMRADVADFSGIMGDTIGSSLLGIGDVFAGAVTRWDGTLKGFFTSVARGISVKWPSRSSPTLFESSFIKRSSRSSAHSPEQLRRRNCLVAATREHSLRLPVLGVVMVFSG